MENTNFFAKTNTDDYFDKKTKVTNLMEQRLTEMYNILRNTSKDQIIDTFMNFLFENTDCYHELWNLEQIQKDFRMEIQKSIHLFGLPGIHQPYILCMMECIRESLPTQQMTKDEFFSYHIIYGPEKYNSISQEEQKKYIQESQEEMTGILLPIQEFYKEETRQESKFMNQKVRKIMRNKREANKRILRMLQKSKQNE